MGAAPKFWNQGTSCHQAVLEPRIRFDGPERAVQSTAYGSWLTIFRVQIKKTETTPDGSLMFVNAGYRAGYAEAATAAATHFIGEIHRDKSLFGHHLRFPTAFEALQIANTNAASLKIFKPAFFGDAYAVNILMWVADEFGEHGRIRLALFTRPNADMGRYREEVAVKYNSKFERYITYSDPTAKTTLPRDAKFKSDFEKGLVSTIVPMISSGVPVVLVAGDNGAVSRVILEPRNP